ncbi:MAG: 50S ribosomal protein L1, partial [Candidatus Thermoplasmatota archaeon]|nr:50S ribosomal protein L1 [Candidatus Thermoplasmatota archaeon]
MTDSKTVEAVQKALEESKKLERKFKQSVDVVINLKNIDMNDAKNRIEDEVMLPHGRGTEAKLALFASGDLALKSKNHVDLLIKPEEIEELAKDKKKFKKIADEYDFFIAEAPLMPTIGKTLGIILGPRGKMPKPV